VVCWNGYNRLGDILIETSHDFVYRRCFGRCRVFRYRHYILTETSQAGQTELLRDFDCRWYDDRCYNDVPSCLSQAVQAEALLGCIHWSQRVGNGAIDAPHWATRVGRQLRAVGVVFVVDRYRRYR